MEGMWDCELLVIAFDFVDLNVFVQPLGFLMLVR